MHFQNPLLVPNGAPANGRTLNNYLIKHTDLPASDSTLSLPGDAPIAGRHEHGRQVEETERKRGEPRRRCGEAVETVHEQLQRKDVLAIRRHGVGVNLKTNTIRFPARFKDESAIVDRHIEKNTTYSTTTVQYSSTPLGDSTLTPEFSNDYTVKHLFAPHGQHAIEWGISRVP